MPVDETGKCNVVCLSHARLALRSGTQPPHTVVLAAQVPNHQVDDQTVAATVPVYKSGLRVQGVRDQSWGLRF